MRQCYGNGRLTFGRLGTVIEVCGGKRLAATCSQRVLLEAQVNIRGKLPTEAMMRFYKILVRSSASTANTW
jgi:hypothetical protein